MQDGNISPVGKFFRNKWVWLIGAVDVLFVIIIIAISANKASETAVINFNVTPVDATITINGSGDYKNDGQAYSFAPGTYEVQISHADLDTKTLTVDLEPSHNTTITTFLSKGDDFYFYTLRANYGSFFKLSSIASARDNQTTDHDTSAEEFIADFEQAYSLYSTELPITYKESEGFGRNLQILKDVTIRADDSCDLTLCIQALMVGTSSEDFIKTLLEEKGFDLEDYEIQYKIY